MMIKNNPDIQTISQALNWGTNFLKKHHIPRAARDCTRLLQDCLKIKKDLFLLKPSTLLSLHQQTQFQQLISRRAQFEPIAYLTGEVIFNNQKIKVNHHVLIPRPETEELVKIVIDELKNYPHLTNLKIIDVGTGSGAIAIALCRQLPQISIIAIDNSLAALKVARQNRRLHHLETRMIIKKSHLLNVFSEKSLDIIIANLPYIPSLSMLNLAPDIIKYEPRAALDGGRDGLNIIKKMLQQAQTHLKSEGMIFLEIWPEHSQSLKRTILQYFPQAKVYFKLDLGGIPRFAIVKL